jgi:hypothetical protein
MGDKEACQDAGISEQQYLLDITFEIFHSQDGLHLT